MLVRVEVDEGFSESSAVVARRDFHETLDGKGCFDGSIGRSCDIVERLCGQETGRASAEPRFAVRPSACGWASAGARFECRG